MEQVSRFNIQGTIGSKISVSVSQDNQTDIPLANRLILRYKGDEDDILKTIEAGNTTLSIPNTQFVGYAARIQGLFGLKTEAQLGNLKLVAIASQEKGSSESAVVSATGEENAEFKRDYQYEEGRIFDLAYKDEIAPDDEVTVWVYEEETRQDNPEAIQFYLDAGDHVDPNNDSDTRDVWMKPMTEGWELLYGQDPARCPVAIVFYSARRYALGVQMEIKHADNTVDTIGNISGDNPVLRILRPPSADLTPEKPPWQLMWRNCYRVPKNIDIDDIEIKIYKGLKGREGQSSNLDYQVVNGASQDPYLTILGLDRINNNIDTLLVPDGKLDNLTEIFRPDWGLLIFPEREPFNSRRTFEHSNGGVSDSLQDLVPPLYDYRSSTDKINESKYYIQMSTRARSSTVRLGRANVIEGSERVTLNGQVLTKGTDYNISYDMGQVTLLTVEALDPNADVQVEFQYAPFMALQKKTLLGMRAEYDYSEDLKLGTTVLYKSDKAQERKPRVGQETAKAMVMDFDISFALHPNFLTRAVDALPLVSSEAASRLKVSAEIAQSRPNPNVDNEAYVDDFESAVERLSLGNVRTRWTLSSRPIQIDSAAYLYTRGSVRWHNPPAISQDEVYTRETVPGEGALQPLRLIFRPKGHMYTGPADDKCSDSIETKSWGGIMRALSGIDEKRLQVFEIRAKGGKGVLHFDFGEISEDVNGNGIGEDEDVSIPKNNTLDVDPEEGIDEDVGIDLIPDAEEFDPCGLQGDSSIYPDPEGDNWWYEGYGKGVQDNKYPPVPSSYWSDPRFMEKVNDAHHWLHYEWQNGTEGNILDDAVQGTPDKEALRNGSTESFETDNVYFTFAVPLSPDPAINPFVVPESRKISPNGDWYTYRVPVRDPGIVDTVAEVVDRTPSWSNVQHVRVWFESDSLGVGAAQGIDEENIDSVVIADWGFVQSNWSDTLILNDPTNEETEFYVAPVAEDDGQFTPPPGVEAYVDKVNNVTETQRGMALVYKNLQPGDECVARKDLLSTEAYSGYRKMEMYVHGDDDLSLVDSLLFFFRIGFDSLNYYEYRTYIDSGWNEDNYVTVDFNEITALKDAADRTLESRQDDLEDSTDVYRVVGRPNINEVRFISASIRNEGSSALSSQDESQVWLDELRVTDVRKDVGTAARVQVSGSLADLLTYNFNYEHRDAFFRGLSQATRGGSSNNLGSGQEQNSISLGGTFNFHKFLPRSWSARIPISFGYSQAETIPLLRTNSDVVLPDDVREQEKSVSKSTKFSVSESFQKKGSNILFNALLNRQSIAFSYNRSRRKTVTSPLIFAENYNVRAEFNMGVSKSPTVPIFFWTRPIPVLKRTEKIGFAWFPTKWRWSATFNRSLQAKDDIDFNRTSSFSRTMTGRMDLTYRPFPTLSIDFSMNTKRDLTDPDLINLSFKNPKLGLENNYNQSFRVGYDPKLMEFLTTALTYSTTYNDTYDRSSATRSTSLNRNWGLSGEFRHQLLLGKAQKKRSGGGRPRPGTVRGGVRTEDEEKSGEPFYSPLLKGLRFLTNWLQPVRYKYSSGFNRSIPGVREKLPWGYRLGFDLHAEFPVATSSRNPSAGEQTSYELGSGFTFLGGITSTIAYKVSKSRSLLSVGADRTESITTSWPEVTVTIRRFTKLPLIQNQVNWFIGVFSPRTGYTRQVKKTENLDRGFTMNRVETIGRTPLISLNLKLFQRLSVSGSYNLNSTYEERYDRVKGELEGETRTYKRTIGVATKYSFNAPGGLSIPLFGKIKFKSMVSIDFSVQYSSNVVESSKKGGEFVPFTNTSSFSASPVISYAFSNQIRGGLTARWQDTNDTQRHKKSHVREVQIWTEIRF
jgi:cell surface protein SprA